MSRTVQTAAPVVIPPLYQAPSPLRGAAFSLNVEDLLVTLGIEQSFANQEAVPIEVSYLWALPSGAQILDVSAQLGDQTLCGRVEARASAEARYETALAEGQSAFCLRMVGPELLHIALGNLLPGETLTLRLQLAWWLHSNDGRLRLTIPTTLAPRYGKPELQPHEQTHSDLLVRYPATLEGEVCGAYATAELSSPSHALVVRALEPDRIRFALRNARLDRDIVLDLDQGRLSTHRLSATWCADRGGRKAALVTLCTPVSSTRRAPVLAEFVLDCSGSMAGTSIEQARAALRAIVAQLDGRDRLNVQRFGTHHEFMLRRPQALTPVIRQTVLDAAATLQADLGGTELMPALHAALEDLARIPADVPGERALFIVSDGEVWNPPMDTFLAQCRTRGVRVFAVAVGSAAVEATFLPMVQGTGGALERVLPADDMAQRIERHFQRVRQGALRELRVRWPGTPEWERLPGATYPGDTALCVAGGLSFPSDETAVELHWMDADGHPRLETVALRPSPSVASDGGPDPQARMLAALRLQHEHITPADPVAWAVDYQLLTAETGLTLVHARAAELGLDALPELRTVPQMLAAGWGGIGLAGAAAPDDDVDGFSFDLGSPVCEAVPAAMSPPAPAPRAATGKTGLPRMIRNFMKRAIPGAGAREALAAASPAARLAEQLTRQLSRQPGQALWIQEARFALEQLEDPLAVELLNWLDALCEALGVGLDHAPFWTALVWQLGEQHHALRVARPTHTPELLNALRTHWDQS